MVFTMYVVHPSAAAKLAAATAAAASVAATFIYV